MIVAYEVGCNECGAKYTQTGNVYPYRCGACGSKSVNIKEQASADVPDYCLIFQASIVVSCDPDNLDAEIEKAGKKLMEAGFAYSFIQDEEV